MKWNGVKILLAIMALSSFAFFGCSESNGTSGGDEDTQEANEGDEYIYYNLGTGSGDGNPAKIDIIFKAFHSMSRPDILVDFHSISMHIEGAFLANEESCDKAHGAWLAAESDNGDGAIVVPLLARETTYALRLFAPPQQDYCSIDFGNDPMISDENAQVIVFHAEGEDNLGRPVIIDSKLYGALPIVANEDSVFRFDEGESAQWLAMLDTSRIFDETMLAQAIEDEAGVVRFDSEHNEKLLQTLSYLIIAAFSMSEDANRNALLDEEEMQAHALIGYGSPWRAAGEEPADGDTDWDIEPQCAEMAIEPAGLEFSAVMAGNSHSMPFQITNTDEDETLEIGAFLIEREPNDAEVYTIENYNIQGEGFATDEVEFPILLSPGKSMTVQVEFSPLESVRYEQTLAIISNDCERPYFKLPMGGGEACASPALRFEPASFAFNQTSIGAFVDKTFTIENASSDDCPAPLEIEMLRLHDESNPDFELVNQENPNEAYDFPMTIAPGESMEVTLRYQPQLPGDDEAELLLVTNVAENDGVFEIPITGSCTIPTGLLTILPIPLDFSRTTVADGVCEAHVDCPLGQSCLASVESAEKHCYKVIEALIYNWSLMTQTVYEVTLASEEPAERFFFVDEQSNRVRSFQYSFGMGLEIPAGANDPGRFQLAYKPDTHGLHLATLTLSSSLVAMPFVEFPVSGFGVGENQCPEARVSLQPGGAEILAPIEDIPMETNLCFYGNISKDTDGRIVDYQWSMPSFPEGSEAYRFTPITEDEANICVDFDLGGDYELTLKVQDDDGCTSEPKRIFVHVNHSEGLAITLTFDGGGDIFLSENRLDVDLVLGCPSAEACEYESIQLEHGAERLLINRADDGMYAVQVRYIDDCQNYITQFWTEFCAGRLRPNEYRLDFTDPANGEAILPSVNDELWEAGDYDEFRLLRQNGEWAEIIRIR